MDAIMKVQHVSKSFMNNNVLKDISLNSAAENVWRWLEKMELEKVL